MEQGSEELGPATPLLSGYDTTHAPPNTPARGAPEPPIGLAHGSVYGHGPQPRPQQPQVQHAPQQYVGVPTIGHTPDGIGNPMAYHGMQQPYMQPAIPQPMYSGIQPNAAQHMQAIAQQQHLAAVTPQYLYRQPNAQHSAVLQQAWTQQLHTPLGNVGAQFWMHGGSQPAHNMLGAATLGGPPAYQPRALTLGYPAMPYSAYSAQPPTPQPAQPAQWVPPSPTAMPDTGQHDQHGLPGPRNATGAPAYVPPSLRTPPSPPPPPARAAEVLDDDARADAGSDMDFA